MSRHTKALLASGLLTLTGCTATPNLSGWAQNSAELAGVVAAENREVLIRLDSNIVELEIGEIEQWKLTSHTSKKWRERRAEYFQSSSDVDATMSAMVLYAEALSNLAAAGETGKESVQLINKSVNEIVDTIGKSNPISGTALAALEEFATAWTLVEAQNSLADAMKATDDNVKKLAALITKSTIAQKEVVEAIRLLERRLIRQAAGPNRMSWYVKNNGFLKIEGAFGDDVDPEHAAAIIYLVESLEPKFRERHTRRAQSTQWVANRKEALDRVAQAADVWQQSHSEAAELLEQCGGLRSLKPRCGNYTAAKIKLAADRIRLIAAATEPADASESQ